MILEVVLPIVSFFLGLFLSKRFLKFMYSVVSGMRRVYTIVENADLILGNLIVLLNTITEAIEDGKLTKEEVYTILKDLENLKRAIAKLEEVVNECGER